MKHIYKRMRPFFPLPALLAALLIMASCDSAPPPARTGARPAPGQAADFTLPDTSGRTFRLSEQRGKTVLIVFSTTWCSTCRSEIPYYKELYARLTPKGVVMVGLDVLESKDKVSRFTARYNLPYRTLLDESGRVADDYRVPGVPAVAIVGPDGVLACSPCGPARSALSASARAVSATVSSWSASMSLSRRRTTSSGVSR